MGGSGKVSPPDALTLGEKPMLKIKLDLATLMLAGMLAVAGSFTAEAAVFKCTDGKSRVFYQDRPCEDLIAASLPGSLSGIAGKNEDRAFFWRALGDGTKLYLLGSLEYGTPAMYPLSQKIMDSFTSANVVVAAADLRNLSEKALSAALNGAGRYVDSSKLEDHIKPTTWTKVSDMVKRLALDEKLVMTAKPWLAAFLLNAESLKQAGYNPEMSAGPTFVKEAEGRKPSLYLGTVEEQIKRYEELSDLDQEQLLIQTLQTLGQASDRYKAISEAWVLGDAERIDMITRQPYDTGEAGNRLFKLFYEDQNRGMANSLLDLAKDGRSYFVIIGVGHLVGDNGILKLLEAKGLTIEQP
jgi:uncharacterized protein YbaP (TraB family)